MIFNTCCKSQRPPPRKEDTATARVELHEERCCSFQQARVAIGPFYGEHLAQVKGRMRRNIELKTFRGHVVISLFSMLISSSGASCPYLRGGQDWGEVCGTD